MSKGVAIVTGSAQGIGRAIAFRLASDGFDIALNDIEPKHDLLYALATEIQALGRRTAILFADVSNELSVEGMVKQAVQELGGLDVMVANAGIFARASILDTSIELWDQIQDVNLRGTFLCFKHAAKRMIEQGRGGRLIGACSVAGLSGYPINSAYSSSKAALRTLTHSAAREFGPHKITVNCYAPGAIMTDMSKDFSNAAKQTFIDAAALGRLGTPEDVSGLVSFLASEDSRFITGQTISVDGGLSFR